MEGCIDGSRIFQMGMGVLTTGVAVPTSVADPGFFPGGAPTPKIAIIFQIFAENCMKMKEFGPGGRASLAPPGSANELITWQNFC